MLIHVKLCARHRKRHSIANRIQSECLFSIDPFCTPRFLIRVATAYLHKQQSDPQHIHILYEIKLLTIGEGSGLEVVSLYETHVYGGGFVF
jgi:hypothetical protein